MQFVSTRDSRGAERVVSTLREAITQGLAPDGGLFVPTELPHVSLAQFEGKRSLTEVGAVLLAPFFAGDALEPALPAILAEAFSFEAPLRAGAGGALWLELFHGPTSAFKDFGARFLAAALARVDEQERVVLVATSGDTGGAVASAFHRRPRAQVVVLYPDGLVSPRQAHQLGAFGDNVHTFRVRGTFDDCQRMVKAALANPEGLALTSANSISLGRLLPQMVYYARASLEYMREHGRPLSFVVPTGNLGNALAAVWARAMGLPIGTLTLATNDNRVLAEYFAGHAYQPRPSRSTLANAMDVGAPSNFERLAWLWPDDGARAQLSTFVADDDVIRHGIAEAAAKDQTVVCPHTATAYQAWRAQGAPPDTALVATAHPAKFEAVVEEVLGRSCPLPEALAQILARPSHAEPLEASEAVLRDALRALAARSPHDAT